MFAADSEGYNGDADAECKHRVFERARPHMQCTYRSSEFSPSCFFVLPSLKTTEENVSADETFINTPKD